jgi:hypothetical protein
MIYGAYRRQPERPRREVFYSFQGFPLSEDGSRAHNFKANGLSWLERVFSYIAEYTRINYNYHKKFQPVILNRKS